MGNSDRKTAAIRKLLLAKADCPRTTCSRSSETPETDAVEFVVIDDYECGINVVSSGLARKLERERDEAIRVLRVLKSDIDHIGHWLPDPCRKMVEAFLSENDTAQATPTKNL